MCLRCRELVSHDRYDRNNYMETRLKADSAWRFLLSLFLSKKHTVLTKEQIVTWIHAYFERCLFCIQRIDNSWIQGFHHLLGEQRKFIYRFPDRSVVIIVLLHVFEEILAWWNERKIILGVCEVGTVGKVWLAFTTPSVDRDVKPF